MKGSSDAFSRSDRERFANKHILSNDSDPASVVINDRFLKDIFEV